MFFTVVKSCQNSAAFRISQLPGVSTSLLEDILDERTVDVKNNRHIIYSYIYIYIKRYLSIQIYIEILYSDLYNAT